MYITVRYALSIDFISEKAPRGEDGPPERCARTTQGGAIGMNRIQFQPGLSLWQFLESLGTEEKFEEALEQVRWPQGFHCTKREHGDHGIVHGRRHKRYQCKECRHQTSLSAGTMMESTKLFLRTWLLAFYFISHAKNDISALDLIRYFGVSFRTTWLIQDKIMEAMKHREVLYILSGKVQIDDV